MCLCLSILFFYNKYEHAPTKSMFLHKSKGCQSGDELHRLQHNQYLVVHGNPQIGSRNSSWVQKRAQLLQRLHKTRRKGWQYKEKESKDSGQANLGDLTDIWSSPAVVSQRLEVFLHKFGLNRVQLDRFGTHFQGQGTEPEKLPQMGLEGPQQAISLQCIR